MAAADVIGGMTVGTPVGASPGQPEQPLGISNLTWSELADALWLASVTPDAGHERTTEQDPPRPQAEAAELATSKSAEPEPPALPWEEICVAEHAATDRQAGAVPHESLGDSDTLAPPTARTLVSSAEMVRALRPLKRKAPSRYAEEVILDEDATAEQAAQDGLWLPVTKQATARWLDLTLVIDTNPSMTLWKSTITEVIALAQRVGAFGSVKLRLLDTQQPAPVLRGGTPATSARSPAELADRSGRRILLVITDGIGQCWGQGLVSPLLARWAQSMPVAVVHLLPQRLWRRGGLALQRARLTVPSPLRPNARWTFELPDAWIESDSAAAPLSAAVPVPVLELHARWLGWWARLISGGYRHPSDATVLLVGDDPRQDRYQDLRQPTHSPCGISRTNGSLSAEERVHGFLSVASPKAYQLATLLSAVPVSVPVAQLVQARLVPGSGPDHLVEVLTSELLRPQAATAGRAWDTVSFEFVDRVREVLLSGARRADTAHVVHLVTEHFGDQMRPLRQLRDALEDPEGAPYAQPTPETAHFVAIERAVMQALSGPYRRRADWLPPESESTGTVSEPIRVQDAVTDRMPAMTDRAVADRPARQLHSPEPTEASAGAVSKTTATDPSATPTTLQAEFGPVTPREKQSPDVPTVWGKIPARNPNFTGRAELLDQLGTQLVAGGTTAVLPAALYGMGGIGKTQVAVEYIYQHLRDYDVVWWIQASESAQIRASLTELAQRLGLPGNAEANTAVPAVQEALRVGEPFHNWLLVFDSAESPETVRAFFPTNGPGQILVTSRNPDWAEIAHPLEVAVFEREESKKLLRLREPEIADEDANQLAEALGDLPLAIAQAATWLAETGMPVSQYLTLFNEKVAEILDTSSPVGYELPVAAAWNVAFDALRTRNPAAHQLLQVCAFFAPEPISRSVFEGVRGVTIAPELDEALRDPMQFSRTIRDINRYGLAKIDHRHNTIQLHRLVQAVLSNHMSAQRSAEMSHGAHLLLTNLDPNDPAPAKHWPRYQIVLPHAYASKVIECGDQWARHLILNLMRFLYFWGDHEEAASLARQAVDVWTGKLGEDHLQTLQAARNLGFYLWTLGRYAEAKEVNQHTVETHRRLSGEDSEQTVLAELAVATDLKGQGDFNAALTLNEQVYQKAKGLFGDDDPTTLMTFHDFVVTLGLAGKYHKARELGEIVYRRRKEVLGDDNPSTLSSLNALILSRREAGEYIWARGAQETVAERSRALLGADKAATLRRFHNLAVARRKAGDHEGALELSTRVLERLQLRYGNDHPNTMACALAHSINLRHDGRLEESRELAERIVQRYTQNLGERHPHTLSALVDSAVTLRLLGDASSARQLDERALEQFRATLGPDHPYSIVSAIGLASDLAALGETEAALRMATEALERTQRVLGIDHPTSLAAMANLVLDLRRLGRTQEAETKYADVATRYRKVLGESHPVTVLVTSGHRADCDIDTLPL